jgi:hypothetical protein
MGSDPKKPAPNEEDLDEGSTAMFSREAHGWFSSMADNQETDPNSVADLGRNAVIESSPLSRTGGLPPASRAGAPGSTRMPTPVPPPVSTAAPSEVRPSPASLASGAASPLAKLDGKQVIVLAFVGGAIVAALLGGIAFFLLTSR